MVSSQSRFLLTIVIQFLTDGLKESDPDVLNRHLSKWGRFEMVISDLSEFFAAFCALKKNFPKYRILVIITVRTRAVAVIPKNVSLSVLAGRNSEGLTEHWLLSVLMTTRHPIN